MSKDVLFNTIYGAVNYEAEEMTREEFESSVRLEKDSPGIVVISDEVKVAHFNDFTCYSSHLFGGTCNCINHQPKVWIKFDPTTGKW